jgi:hypothetical protein
MKHFHSGRAVCILFALLTAVSCAPTGSGSEGDIIRAEQAVRDAVVPNVHGINSDANDLIDELFASIGLGNVVVARHELSDWQTELEDSDVYRVTVTVQYHEECQPKNVTTCAEQLDAVKQFYPGSLALNGCHEPAQFQVFLKPPLTVVPKNACAESIYYQKK